MAAATRVTIVEDDAITRCLLEDIAAARGYNVTLCATAEAGWSACHRSLPAILLLDRHLPDLDGLELCRRIRALPEGSQPLVVVLTADQRATGIMEALAAGADDFIAKPVQRDLLNVRLQIAEHRWRERTQRHEAEKTVSDLRQLLDEGATFERLVGRSKTMHSIFGLVENLARVDITVLIEGETGTGKELVARAIHNRSPRRDGPFIAVNCAGLPESLVASQLFGHRRGAFTGAIEDQKGFFEAANKGTLFLDEIGDVPLTIQPSLLRVLQERELQRLGEATPRKVDVRVVAATHRDLDREVANGTFRSDLLYRIRVARVRLPPLRERRDDILLLARKFLDDIRLTTGNAPTEISNAARRILSEYAWPGNVRELRSAMEYAAITPGRICLDVADLPPEVVQRGQSSATTPLNGGEDGRARILEALAMAKGSRSAAAEILGISRGALYRHLTAYAIPTKIRRKGTTDDDQTP